MVVIKYLYRKTFLRIFLKPLYSFFLNRIISDKLFIKKKYKNVFGEFPNLDNPTTFNEKINWLKLNDRTDLHTKCADKFLSRSYIKDKVGGKYLVPLEFQTKDISKISYKNLPDYPVIIKPSHGAGIFHIVIDKNDIDFKSIQKDLKKAMGINHYYYGKEWQYKNIVPRILVEKLLIGKNGKISNDYKFSCFNGKVHFIYVSIDREGLNKRNIYDRNWSPLFFTWANRTKNPEKLRGKEIPPPQNYKTMLEIAELLAKDFRYARIDLYNIDGAIYCGEITFHPGSGFDIFTPREWDYKLGDLLKL